MCLVVIADVCFDDELGVCWQVRGEGCCSEFEEFLGSGYDVCSFFGDAEDFKVAFDVEAGEAEGVFDDAAEGGDDAPGGYGMFSFVVEDEGDEEFFLFVV